jgi:hypothetical protein
MKNPIFIFLFLIIGLQLAAQQSTVIRDTTYFRRLYNAGSARTLTKDSVLQIRCGSTIGFYCRMWIAPDT